MKEINNEFLKQQFEQRENAVYHPTYDNELAFYEQVKQGNLDTVNYKQLWGLADMQGRGILSANPIRNLKYHLIVCIAMLCRFCMEGGMDEKEAYGLSDVFINRIDVAQTEEELKQLQREFITAFATRMKKLHARNVVSPHCVKAIDYIHDHLHDNITLPDIADFVGLDETYMSKLFKKETGQTISVYISRKRVEAAKNMLMYSDFSCAEIAQYLHFSSSSHFGSVFKKMEGMTPLQYRSRNYRKHWEMSE